MESVLFCLIQLLGRSGCQKGAASATESLTTSMCSARHKPLVLRFFLNRYLDKANWACLSHRKLFRDSNGGKSITLVEEELSRLPTDLVYTKPFCHTGRMVSMLAWKCCLSITSLVFHLAYNTSDTTQIRYVSK